MRVAVADSLDALAAHLEAWDALAVARAAPYGAPGWLLAWWRQLRPDEAAQLRVVLVHDDDGTLIGVGPWFAHPGRWRRTDYRLLGSGTFHRIGPLAAAGREAEVAGAFGEALAGARPRASLVSLEGLDSGSPWPALLRAHWPGRSPSSFRTGELVSPVLRLEAPDFDTWLAARSANFRKQAKAWRNRVARRGATLRVETDAAGAQRAAEAFGVLHDSRWAERGGSGLGGAQRTAAFLRDAAGALPLGERLRLITLELDGAIIGVHVCAAAGGEVTYFNGGWDEVAADLKPAMASLLLAIQDAFERGDDRVDFGGGDHPYKLRFTDGAGDDALSWSGLFPIGPRYPLTRLQLAPEQLRTAATRHLRALPPERREQLKRLLRR